MLMNSVSDQGERCCMVVRIPTFKELDTSGLGIGSIPSKCPTGGHTATPSNPNPIRTLSWCRKVPSGVGRPRVGKCWQGSWVVLL